MGGGKRVNISRRTLRPPRPIQSNRDQTDAARINPVTGIQFDGPVSSARNPLLNQDGSARNPRTPRARALQHVPCIHNPWQERRSKDACNGLVGQGNPFQKTFLRGKLANSFLNFVTCAPSIGELDGAPAWIEKSFRNIGHF